MGVTRHHFRREDSERVSEFLIKHYMPGNQDGNWLQPAWEYAMTHPCLDQHSLGSITIWEDDGEIVAVSHYEHRLGEAFFQIHPQYGRLKPQMLDCAEVNLRAANAKGHVVLNCYVNDFDAELETMVQSRGYVRRPDLNRPLLEYSVTAEVEPPALPDGYRVLTLAEENDLTKVDRVLWRGFNHPGEPPAESRDGRRAMQSGPRFRKDLAVVVREPGGAFVSYCGMWYVPEHAYAYVEPMATDPEFRRKGIGSAAVMEGIRRCAAEGANVVYVGSGNPFYAALGFVERHVANCWQKTFNR